MPRCRQETETETFGQDEENEIPCFHCLTLDLHNGFHSRHSLCRHDSRIDSFVQFVAQREEMGMTRLIRFAHSDANDGSGRRSSSYDRDSLLS